MSGGLKKHWQRLRRSLGRRWKEARLPRGYARLGTRYGGWWVDSRMISREPLLIDCGLGVDISFPVAFLDRFGGRAIGVEANPHSFAYCAANKPRGMDIIEKAFWTEAGASLTFHLPRAQDRLPKGADGVSGSLMASHEYVNNGASFEIATVNLAAVLELAGRETCDVLKLDIEGAEYEVLTDLCRSGDIRRAGQVLIEFHHRVTHHSLADTNAAAAQVVAAGFELVHTEGRNYIFRRRV